MTSFHNILRPPTLVLLLFYLYVLSAHSISDLGINCEGDWVHCLGAGNMIDAILDRLHLVNPTDVYIAGAHIMCFPAVSSAFSWFLPAHSGFCLFLQGERYSINRILYPDGSSIAGINGTKIKECVIRLSEHGCTSCSSCPLDKNNNPHRLGILTLNYVHNRRGCAEPSTQTNLCKPTFPANSTSNPYYLWDLVRAGQKGGLGQQSGGIAGGPGGMPSPGQGVTVTAPNGTVIGEVGTAGNGITPINETSDPNSSTRNKYGNGNGNYFLNNTATPPNVGADTSTSEAADACRDSTVGADDACRNETVGAQGEGANGLGSEGVMTVDITTIPAEKPAAATDVPDARKTACVNPVVCSAEPAEGEEIADDGLEDGGDGGSGGGN